MIVITSVFVSEANRSLPLTFAQLEEAREDDHEEEQRELIGLYEGKNRVLPLE